jgi:hypothetical protein
MNQGTGKYIIIAGAVIIIIGVIIYFFHGSFKWFGRLPGDVNVKKENYSFHFPWVTMLVISVVLTLIINFIRRFF